MTSLKPETKSETKTTQQLSTPGCTDIEQYTNVTIATIRKKDGNDSVFLMHGVFYDEMVPIEEKDFLPLKAKHSLVDQNYAFCLYTLDSFIAEVCEKGDGYLYWPRTNMYYRVPDWYRDKLPKSLAALRALVEKTVGIDEQKMDSNKSDAKTVESEIESKALASAEPALTIITHQPEPSTNVVGEKRQIEHDGEDENKAKRIKQ